jgi:hypothetical protein
LRHDRPRRRPRATTTPARRVGGLFALLIAITPAIAAKPDKEYPEFKNEKASLGKVALLTDVVVVEDVIGTTEKVYLGDCMRLSDLMLKTFRDALEPRGYSFSRMAVASVGNVTKPGAQYRIYPSWDQHKEDAEKFPLATAPFYEDSVLAGVSGGHDALSAVLNEAWSIKVRKNEPPPSLPQIATLHDAIGSDYAILVVVVGTKIPFGKKFGQGMLSGLTHTGGSSGNVSFSAGVDFTQYSGTGIRTTVVDCRTGRVMWSDGDHEDKSLNDDNLAALAKDVLKRMP